MDKIDASTLSALCDIFGVSEDDYITTVKLKYIYQNTHGYSQLHSLKLVKDLALVFKSHLYKSNAENSIKTVDNFYRFIQGVRFQNYDTALKPPHKR